MKTILILVLILFSGCGHYGEKHCIETCKTRGDVRASGRWCECKDGSLWYADAWGV